MNNKRLLIIGASGHGRVVADIAVQMEEWDNISFLDDDEMLIDSKEINVIGKLDEITKFINDYDVFVGIGNNMIRRKIINNLDKLNASIPTIIHPKAIIGKNVQIGIGTVIMAGSVINCDSVIGKGCIINTSSSIDHDNLISDFVHISPGVNLAGAVMIGSNTWIGIGSVISNNVKIGSDIKIGAGSVVINDIAEKGTYVGVPAKKISS